jgi:hypothetical protein
MWILYHEDQINADEITITYRSLFDLIKPFTFSDFIKQKRSIYIYIYICVCVCVCVVHKKRRNVSNVVMMLYFQLYVGILRHNENTHKIFNYFDRFPGQFLNGISNYTVKYQWTYLYFRDRNNDMHSAASRIFLTHHLKEANFFIHYVEIPYRIINEAILYKSTPK